MNDLINYETTGHVSIPSRRQFQGDPFVPPGPGIRNCHPFHWVSCSGKKSADCDDATDKEINNAINGMKGKACDILLGRVKVPLRTATGECR